MCRPKEDVRASTNRDRMMSFIGLLRRNVRSARSQTLTETSTAAYLVQSSHENLPPHIMRAIAKEVRKLATCPPAGITFDRIPKRILLKFTLISKDRTTRCAGRFDQTRIGRDYPSAPPRATF